MLYGRIIQAVGGGPAVGVLSGAGQGQGMERGRFVLTDFVLVGGGGGGKVGASHDDSAAKALRERGPETVIITLGAKGSLIHSAHLTEFVPAFPTQAVDTTAAGDVFNGALAVGLDEGKSLKEAVVFATAASSIAVSRMGAQSSAPEREEVEQKLINRP